MSQTDLAARMESEAVFFENIGKLPDNPEAKQWGADLRAAAEAVRAMQWRPIGEAPKDGTKVDLWTENGRIADCWWDKGHWKHWWIGGFDNMGPCRIGEIPTHYLPRPAPPEATR